MFCFYRVPTSPDTINQKFPWLPPHAADPGGLGYALCLKHQRRSSHGRPKAPNLHFIFVCLGRFIYEGLPCLSTPATVPARVATIAIFPRVFRSFRYNFGCFSVIFGLGGAPATSGGTPWPPEGSQGHFGRSFCHSIASFWGSFGNPSDDLFTVFSGLFSGARFLGARGDVLTRKVPEKVPR